MQQLQTIQQLIELEEMKLYAQMQQEEPALASVDPVQEQGNATKYVV